MFDEDELAAIRSSFAEWKANVRDPFMAGRDSRQNRFATVSNIPIDEIYTPDDMGASDYEADIGFPGVPPFTRGVYPTMYRGRLWTMRQFAGYGVAEETNERFKYLVSEGQTGLSTAFDMPSLMGIDSDAEMAFGEVGREGVAVDTLRDMEVLFDGIALEDVSTSFTINPSAPVIYAMYVALADNRGVDRKELRGTLQNDMLKEFIAQKEWVIPPEPSLALVTDVIEFSIEETPGFYPISISGYHIREAGSTAVEELAFTLADGFAYIEDAQDRGLSMAAFGPALSFFFNCHNSLFEEVAKFRAGRRIYARLLEDWYGVGDTDAKRLKFHTQTAGASLTAQQPMNNIVRTTVQALAAVLGGTQSLHTNSYDEALALPSEEAVRIALRTQQIIAEESGVADSVDPLGGSYLVESLTDEIESRVMAYLEEIRELGNGSMRDGVLRGIDEGYFQREIQESAYEYQARVERGEETVVGVNKYTSGSDDAIDTIEIDAEEAREHQLTRLADVKAERDESAVRDSLADIHSAITTGENTMPAIVRAVKTYATMGEIMGVFEDEYGSYQESAIGVS